GRRCLHFHDPYRSSRDVTHQLPQAAHVVHVLQTLPHGFQDHREPFVLRRHGEQLRRPLPLLPQRGAPPRVTAWQQQGTRRAFAEPCREQRGATHFGGDQGLDLVGVEQDVLGADQHLPSLVVQCVRQTQDDPVVRVHHVCVHVPVLSQPCRDGQRPRRVHPRAEGGVHDHPPVTQLVPETFEQDRPVTRHVSGGGTLLVHIGQEVPSRTLVQTGLRHPAKCLLFVCSGQEAEETSDCATQFRRPA